MSRPTVRQRELTRREMIRRATCAAFATAAVAGTVRDLRLMNAAAADALPAPATDYKALVCIFLGGGSDCNNFLIPIEDTPTGYQQYSLTRSVAAIPLTAFTAANTLTSLNTNDPHTYGVHPKCPQIASLFNTGKLAFVCNVGPLLFPINRTQYKSKQVPYPPQLFSHNDQVIQWQTSIPDRDSRTGWAGRVADLTYAMNSSNAVSMSISIAGVNTLEVGDVVNEYSISSSGPQGLSTGTEINALNAQLKNINNYSLTPASSTFPQTNLYEVAYAGATKRGIDNFAAMNSAIFPTDERAPSQGSGWVWQTPFPTSSLGKQLKMVARCIAGRKILGHQRQIFFVTQGGFDTHTQQFDVTGDTTIGTHANLLTDLNACVNAFQAAIDQLRSASGQVQMSSSDNVTGFTASDFGRTGVTNGGGTDHGWGSHHIVFGDQVIGQKTYGAFPDLRVSQGDDSGDSGRWIPKISVDEYSATLAKWFGVPPSNLNTIFPNLGRFLNPDLGFMASASPAAVPLAKGSVIRVSAAETIAPAKSVKPTAKPAPAKTPVKPAVVERPAMRKS